MTHPEQVPERLGLPCWASHRPDIFLQAVARVDQADADGFLATHSPIAKIESKDGNKTEAEVFDWLFKRKARETLVVVTGEPGSGKSHFINWLKLRLDDSLRRGERSQIRSVLVKRRSGSLRDALEQLLEQLGDFEYYLDPVRAALAKLSPDIAKTTLCFALSNLIRENPITDDRRLGEFHEYFNDTGSLKWLCRPNGAIDRNVQRLILASGDEERESIPLIELKDLVIKDPDALRRAGPTVQELNDILEGDDERCQRACDRANLLLRPALERLTGLGNKTLHQIFRDIRRDLEGRGESLALFIEDVSTLSALDTEIFNALEPQNDSALCRLYGVLGMTTQAFDGLPENMQQRASLALSIGGSDANAPLRADSAFADTFVARYLNALRLSDLDIGRLADYRRKGLDVCVSACEDCNLRQNCFDSFGSVKIAESEIGLFPFREGSLLRLLDGLREIGGVRRNPRGLLQHIVVPVLAAVGHGVDRSNPNMGLSVEAKPPRDIDSASAKFLGGWDDRSKQRLRFLLWYWIGEETIQLGASRLNLIRSVFALPEFSQVPPSPPEKKATPSAPDPKVTPPPVQNATYEGLSKRLESWVTNRERLKGDNDFRENVLPLIKRSIPWDDLRAPSWPARDRAVDCDTRAVQIENMVSNSAIAGVRFPVLSCNEDSSSFLRATLRFRYFGQRSWRYPESVVDRRIIGQWLRANTESFIRVVDPVELDPREAVESGIRFLMVAYQLSNKKPLPIDLSEASSALFSFTFEAPFAYSDSLKVIANDLPDRVGRIREFIWNELNVPQGTGGVLFIDPLPIISAISSYRDDVEVPKVDDRFGTSHWQARFGSIVALSRTSWTKVETALEDERAVLNQKYNSVRAKLASWQLASESMGERIAEFFNGCKGIKSALAQVDLPTGSDEVSSILGRRDNPDRKWEKTLRDLEAVTVSEDVLDVLRFDSSGLLDVERSLATLDAWVNDLQTAVEKRYADGLGGGNLDEEIAQAVESLDRIQHLNEGR